MSAPIGKPYTSLPDYADIAYVDGKLRVASGIARRAKDPERRRCWLETADILLDQRIALATLDATKTTTDGDAVHEGDTHA